MSIDLIFPAKVRGLISTMNVFDCLDIFIVAVILYKIYLMIEDTRAITLVKGLAVLVLLYALCVWSELNLLTWLFEKIMSWSIVALPIVFQPEIRRTLEKIGQGKFVFNDHKSLNEEEAMEVVTELVKAAKNLSDTKTGALIVIEREMGLNDIADTGIKLDAKITAELLQNIFFVNTPLHDGAVIIRGKKIVSAGCLLPLTEKHGLSKELGTRHRAALGISEQCDAIILVVSEETGTISIAENGKLKRRLDGNALIRLLRPAFESPVKPVSFFELIKKWRREK